jgi:hypothetical protein
MALQILLPLPLWKRIIAIRRTDGMGFSSTALSRDKVFNLAADEDPMALKTTARSHFEGEIYGAGLRYRKGPASLLH